MSLDRWISKKLLLTAQLLLIAQISAASTLPQFAPTDRINEHCYNISSHYYLCNCLPVGDGFHITCPGEGIRFNITMRIQKNIKVQIECRRIDPLELEYIFLPKMSIGNILEFRMHQCQLPLEQPIQTILQKLGITRVNTLFLDNKELGGSLKRLHFQGLDNLIRIKLSSNGISTLPDDAFTDLKKLTWLSLRSNKVELSANTFASLRNLKFLELADNKITDLPPGVFNNQKKLNKLIIRINNLTSISKEAFEGLSSVTELDLNNNNIATLPLDVFYHLKNLKNIDLSGNQWRTLPVGLFSKNKNLTYFRLYGNGVALKHLPAGLLSNLHILREVILNCNLETISPDVFANSNAIRNITISENNLTELPPRLFADQKELMYLNLTRNKLIALPDDIFWNKRNLVVLWLSHNKLKNITAHIFNSLENLEELYMDNNNLVRISTQAFTNTKKLTYINMESNKINISSRRLFRGLWKLTTLNLRNNSITSIPKLWSISPSHVDLSYNNIDMFDETDLKKLSGDVSINLTHNTIRTINFDRINYLKIGDGNVLIRKTHVAIGENPIKCDCGLASFLSFLNGNVGHNLRRHITFSTEKLQCNAPAILKGRFIAEFLLMEFVCPLDESSTQWLCPTGCVCLENTFDRILVVNCSNTQLTQIPALSMMEVWNGTELHLKNNSLTQISIENLPKNIILLDVSYNNLEQLTNSMLMALQSNINLYSLALSHNPWLCDCKSKDLFQFAHSYHERFPDLKEMQCVSGEKFLEISVNTICSDKQGLVTVVGMIILVIGFCVTAVAALYYRYQLEIKIWLYAHKMCLWCVTEEELDKDKKYDAFISFSQKDEDFVMNYLVPELENGPTSFKLCLHVRDWMAGDFISDQIIRSVDESRRTIIVLSPNFIESIWAGMEFRTAHSAALNEGRIRVIVIILGEIGNIDTLDPDLKAYLRMNTYIKWGDPWFWDKLRYALPHPSNNISGLGNEMVVHKSQWKMEMTTNPTM